MRSLPVNLHIENRLCVIVGGGAVALRKAIKLINHRARVRAVSTSFANIEKWPEGIELIRRPYSNSDLQGAFLVVAATENSDTNREIIESARSNGSMGLRADEPEAGDLSFPATLWRGDLAVSFSTEGASPSFAAMLRDQAAEEFGDAHADFCALAREIRQRAIDSFSDSSIGKAEIAKTREAFLRELPFSGILDLLRKGQHDAASRKAEELLRNFIESVENKADREIDRPREQLEPGSRPAPSLSHRASEVEGTGGKKGLVYLAGAGPGDPSLITVKTANCLRIADTVLFDALVNPEMLRLYCPNAEQIDVSKRKGKCERSQDEIIALLIERASRGEIVVRLKGGDPTVFGRGGEEARALRSAGIDFEMVPGVSSATAVPIYAGIPVTDRDLSSSFGVYSAHRRGGLALTNEEWIRIAQGPDTLVLLMGKTRCREVAENLIRFGRPASTPVAFVFNGTTDRQQTITGTLQDIAGKLDDLDQSGPGLIVVGKVVLARSAMKWFREIGADGRRET